MPTAKPSATKTAATKRAAAAKAASTAQKRSTSKAANESAKPKLTPTDDPEVFINEAGVRCDRRGIALFMFNLKQAGEAQERAVLGRLAESPAEVLKVAAMDRGMPIAFRVDAAAKAAPYFDRKMPLAVDGGADPQNPNGPGLPINISNLKGLSDAELAQLKTLLTKAKPSDTA